MKFKSAFSILPLLMLFSLYSNAQSCWNEVWKDDFNGTSLDTDLWMYEIGNGCPSLCGWGNNERQYYTNNPSNVSVSGGYLNITARYEPNYAGSGNNFTSARVLTKDKHSWRYGRFEASIKLPAGNGVWPAFWMLPQSSPYGGWPTSGEIDIMEYRGDHTNKTDGTLHYGNPSPQNQYDGSAYILPAGNFTDNFHLFAVEWTPDEIRWYVDNNLFKTVTRDPNNLNPPSNNAVTWPWDQDFFMILNVAIGGWYAGNPSEADIINGNTSWSANMQVDYVKVYTDLSGGELTGTINGKTSVLPGETGIVYSIPATDDANYAWTVSDGTIVSGNGTNTIEVTWGTGSGTVAVIKTIDCGSANYTLPVTIMPVSCGTMLEDFEFTRFNTYGYIHGQLNAKETNPAPSAENTSPVCARYIRNPAEEFDVIVVENLNFGNADLIENNSKRFMMDVYSNAAGRNIEITLENSNTSSAPFPTGRHSTYRATTTVANAWETLTFQHVASPEPGLAGTSVNQLVLLFMPGAYNSNTFYFDNLMLAETPVAGTITGATAVCNDQQNVIYSVPNKAGVTYTWGIPSDAMINSGQGSNTLNVTFGTAGGNISVTPAVGTCTGTTVSKAITNTICTPTAINRASMSPVHLFPNPASDLVMLSLNPEYQTGAITVQILESTGRVISETSFQNPSGDEVVLPLTDLKPGHYLLKISNGENSQVKNLLKK